MTVDEIKEAIERKFIVFIKFEGKQIWGILKSLSDDESIVYYSQNGTHLLYGSAPIDKVSLDEDRTMKVSYE